MLARITARAGAIAGLVILALVALAGVAAAGSTLRYQCYWIWLDGSGSWRDHSYNVWSALKASGRYCRATY